MYPFQCNKCIILEDYKWPYEMLLYLYILYGKWTDTIWCAWLQLFWIKDIRKDNIFCTCEKLQKGKNCLFVYKKFWNGLTRGEGRVFKHSNSMDTGAGNTEISHLQIFLLHQTDERQYILVFPPLKISFVYLFIWNYFLRSSGI